MTAYSLAAPFRLIALEKVDSTNDEARRAAQAGSGHGTVVWAREQTAGRGRRGREWVSPAGNLHCSLLLDGGPEPSRTPQLAFVAAVAVRAALADLVPGAVFQVKWPNDVLCHGRKISGMLLEQASSLIVAGIGVDVAFAPEPGLYPTTCLRQLGSGAEPFDVLAGLCEHLGVWYARWRSEGFAPIRQAWLDGAAGLSGPVTVRLSDETVLEGTFAGLDPEGALLLVEAGGGQRKVLAGDVFFRR
ncbi:biotin--[acetyl-CoA-carboxylase] ligase [Telmatospirillum siberiense]|uniref:biotin--[biotin carboxyl-carrier protein] ligase n=1 Tax=Telmatospirillum siberiense TaxID=382514 RepID=A0A2N3PZJ1_9PROT|nr:biotin--[acetyl-CoA-carboxylase] ligase [Telmatospirillum siberiense]PKU25830.1 biotin--[acetyl-CoA-carboxylase] ligase [Telmatospirillum siberiense]